MTLHHETVSLEMLTIAKTVFISLPEQYYLAGGTALALLIGHRKSIDLDYFIPEAIDTEKLRRQLSELFGAERLEIIFEEKNTLWCNIDGVKVSFISRFDPLLKPATLVDSFRMVSLEDITLMKLSAICGREEYKDYFDLACIAEDADVRTWLTNWQSIYPNIDPTSWVVALAAVDDTPKIPLEILPPFEHIDPVKEIHRALVDITKYAATL
jgi:predicted nucleotidyltransferase component of viral defense system